MCHLAKSLWYTWIFFFKFYTLVINTVINTVIKSFFTLLMTFRTAAHSHRV